MNSVRSSFTTAGIATAIALVYMLVVHLWWKVPWSEALRRTGLTAGSGRWWLIAVGLSIPILGYSWLVCWLMPVKATDTTSPYHVFVGQGLGPGTMAAAAAYGFVSAGYGEELLFRGLIAGALSRHLKMGRANLIQALIFLAPHLFLLLVIPWKMAFLLVGVFALGLMNGWLRLRSGSIGPGFLLHGLGNTLVGVLAALS